MPRSSLWQKFDRKVRTLERCLPLSRHSVKPPSPTYTRATIDTIELFVRRPPRDMRKELDAAVGKRVGITDVLDKGRRVSVLAAVNRVPLSALPVLAKFASIKGSSIYRVDIAFDFDAAEDVLEYYSHGSTATPC